MTRRDKRVLSWIAQQYAVRFDHVQQLLSQEPGHPDPADTTWAGTVGGTKAGDRYRYSIKLGGVATRADSRRHGLASSAMQRAAEAMRDEGVDVGLLFCEPRHVAFYRRLGWRAFEGEVFAEQPQGRIRFDVTRPMVLDLALAPRTGVLDLRGLPW